MTRVAAPALLSPALAAAFAAYPRDARARLMHMRSLVFHVAATTPGVGALTETLKWGEPAYLTAETGAGSTIRIGWKAKKPAQVSMYFNCQTTLVETFRTVFPSDFKFEGNRELVLALAEPFSEEALSACIEAALTYHRRKR
jgi:hypothetical protein